DGDRGRGGRRRRRRRRGRRPAPDRERRPGVRPGRRAAPGGRRAIPSAWARTLASVTAPSPDGPTVESPFETERVEWVPSTPEALEVRVFGRWRGGAPS